MDTLMRTFRQGSNAVVAILFLAMLSAQAVANDKLVDTWLFSGFGTLGYSQTDKFDERSPRRNVYQSGERLKDNGFLMDSRFGLQLSAQVNDHWEMVGQILVREQFSDHLEDYLNMAFVRYRVNNQWQVSLGRQAFDIFFLSDHRNIGYSYEWVRPPTEFYGVVPNDSFDGLKIDKNWGDFDSSWHWSLSIGNIKAKFDSNVVQETETDDSAKSTPIYGNELSWQSEHWQLRASIAILEFKQKLAVADLLASLAPIFKPIWPEFDLIVADFPESYHLRYGSIGASWQRNNWKVQAEWNIIDTDDVVSFKGQRAYLHLSKRWQDWQPFVTLGYAYNHTANDYIAPAPDIGLTEFYNNMVDVVQNANHNQHSISVGVRWDFAPQKALKLQCDQFYFKAGAGSIYGRVDLKYRNNEIRSWCSVTLDWVF